MFPSSSWEKSVKEGLMAAAPSGLNQIFTQMCGSCANEGAMKAAFMAYRNRERGANEFTPEELSSCMRNEAPGSPELCVMSIGSAFHGRLFGSLSLTRSKAIHKVDIPAFQWPTAPWPDIQYPMEDFETENQAAEAKSLKVIEQMIQDQKATKPVAALIVEPIQSGRQICLQGKAVANTNINDSEGGDKHASPAFFRSLREITKKHGVYLIVDEVQTGVGKHRLIARTDLKAICLIQGDIQAPLVASGLTRLGSSKTRQISSPSVRKCKLRGFTTRWIRERVW